MNEQVLEFREHWSDDGARLKATEAFLKAVSLGLDATLSTTRYEDEDWMQDMLRRGRWTVYTLTMTYPAPITIPHQEQGVSSV